MNDEAQKKAAALRDAQQNIHAAVNDLRNKRPGMSFQTAWSTLQQTRSDLFDSLDKASSELTKITRGQNQGDPFYRSQGLEEPTARDNVPPSRPGQLSKPPGQPAPETRVKPDFRSRDSRITGVHSVVRSVR
jgi:hypothetical protein